MGMANMIDPAIYRSVGSNEVIVNVALYVAVVDLHMRLVNAGINAWVDVGPRGSTGIDHFQLHVPPESVTVARLVLSSQGRGAYCV